MTGFVLKLIACLTMLIDHITFVCIPQTSALYIVGRSIGRIAFPIFAFLIVEGFFYTKDLKKYMLRLGIAAVLSEVPFDMMGYGRFFSFLGQNVLWTLLLGLITIAIMDYVKTKAPGDVFKYNLFSCIAIICFGGLSIMIGTDYSVFGVMLVVGFYVFRQKKVFAMIMMLVLVIVFQSIVTLLEALGLLAFIFIFLYNGKKGVNDHHIMYAFYPIHMLVLGIINMFLL